VAGDAVFGRRIGGLQFGYGGGDAVWVGGGEGYCCAEFETGFCDAVADAWFVRVRKVVVVGLGGVEMSYLTIRQ
jgi:hypothetical protein